MEAGKPPSSNYSKKMYVILFQRFQRPYVWDQEKQWEPLWDDVRNLAERYAEALVEADIQAAMAEEKTGTHFLGAIVYSKFRPLHRDRAPGCD